MVPKGVVMNIDEQLFGAGAPSWAERLSIAKLYDLGKFFFGVGTATIGFLFTAQKMNPSGTWEPDLKTGFGLLVLSLAISILMVILAAPYLKEKLAAARTWAWPHWVINGIVVAWFLAWGAGTLSGVRAVLA
jgi:hypothetical protein